MTEKTMREITAEEQEEVIKKMWEEQAEQAKWWAEKKAEYEAEKNYPFSCSGNCLVVKRKYEKEKYEFEIVTGFVKGAGNWVHKHSAVAKWINKKTIEINDYFLAQMFNEECDLGGAMCFYDN